MCGIGGIYSHNYSDDYARADEAQNLIYDLRDRGKHASGFTWCPMNGDEVLVHKSPVDAKHFFRTNLISKKAGNMNRFIMLHTRFTTQGSTRNNFNNHPIVSQNLIVTHNGVISNYDEPSQKFNVKRQGEVDSESINIAPRHGRVAYTLDTIQGSMSVAWADQKQPEIVNLMTNGRNPLVIGITACKRTVWASNRYHIEENFDLIDWFHADPYTHYILKPDGIIKKVIVEGDFRPRIMNRYDHRAVY